MYIHSLFSKNAYPQNPIICGRALGGHCGGHWAGTGRALRELSGTQCAKCEKWYEAQHRPSHIPACAACFGAFVFEGEMAWSQVGS